MRAIVIGIGEVGQHIARTLSAERHDVTVVDRDAARVDGLMDELDALVLAGNGASPRFLREIGAGQADLLCAVTQSDEVNVIAALAGHQLGVDRTVARVRDPDYFDPEQSFARDVLGIDFIIHPERATADDIAESVLLPGAVRVEHFVDGKVALAEVILTNRSPLVGQPLGLRRMVRPHTIVGLIRAGRSLAAEEGHRPKVGDHILVVASREEIAPVLAHLAGRTTKLREAMIFGGGRIGLPLARRLEAIDRLNVTVMERDPDRARYVAEQLRRATVLHEEGVGKDALLAHGVDRAGAFVAAAGDDRANLLAAVNAKQVGAESCLAVVSREEFTPLVDALGIDGGFSPRLVTAEAILRAVRGSNVEAVHLLLGGAEVLELQVEPGCQADGQTPAQVEATAYTHIAAIVRDGRVLMPDAAQVVRGGDRIVVFHPRRGVSEIGRALKAT
jgi:trk system potassium uptake protein TrkA